MTTEAERQAIRERARRVPAKGKTFRQQLRERFSSPIDVLKCLGLDSAENIANLVHQEKGRSMEKSRSVMDDPRAHELMAQHGHAGDWRKFGRDCGLSEDDLDHLESLWSMEPHRQKIEGEDDEQSEERLESPARIRESSTNINPGYEANAEKWNMRSSEQHEGRDSMPVRMSNGMPRARIGAQDGDSVKPWSRIGTSEAGNPARQRAEERAMAEVMAARKLAGVGAPRMGMDSRQLQERADRIRAAQAKLFGNSDEDFRRRYGLQ
jgi:hypothetical protein